MPPNVRGSAVTPRPVVSPVARDLLSGLKATEVTSCQYPGTRGGVNAPIRLYNGRVADDGGAADDLGRGALVSAGTAKTLMIAAAASKTAPDRKSTRLNSSHLGISY